MVKHILEPIGKTFDEVVEAVAKHTVKPVNVFSGTRELQQPIFNVRGVKLDSK